MKNNLPKTFILLFPIILLTSSCTDVRQALGKEKVIPDEYSVVLTPSLTIPPGYQIDPGLITSNSIVNSDQNTELENRLNLDIKKENSDNNDFIELFGSNKIPKNIRTIVDEETLGIALGERTGMDVLFGKVPKTGLVIDTKKESLRIRNNTISGKKINEDASPAFEINSGKTLLIK